MQQGIYRTLMKMQAKIYKDIGQAPCIQGWNILLYHQSCVKAGVPGVTHLDTKFAILMML
jgi:hypothetical protein